METLRKDVVYALRQLAKSPVFTLVAVLTLALGIGANTAVFSVMDAVLLRSLPVRHPHGLYYVHMANGESAPRRANSTGDSNTSFSMPVFEAIRQQKRVFQDLIAYIPLGMSKEPVEIGRTPLEAEGEEVSGNYFSGLTAGVTLGRALDMRDEAQHTPVIVLSYAFWTKAFARNPHVLGSTVYVKGVPLTVVGVAKRGFFGIEPGKSIDFWMPLQTNPVLNAWGTELADGPLYSSPSWWCVPLMARLAPRVTPQQAQAAAASTLLAAAQQGIGTIRSKEHWKPLLAFDPARGLEGYSEQYQQPVEVLMGLVLLILLIAVTNVAMMISARNAARLREFSLRLTLGAKRSRLFAQLLTESGLLVVAGAELGWLFAVEATRWLAGMAQLESGLAPNSTVLAFTLVVSALAALLFGLMPLRAATRAPMAAVLRSGGTQLTLDRKAVLAGNVALVAQVALCLVLLMTGGLLLHTLSRYQNQTLGMDADHLLVFGLTPTQKVTPEQALVFYRSLLDRLRALPGVRGAAMVGLRPGSGWSSNREFLLDGVHQNGVLLRRNWLGAGYFEAVGTPMLMGREFTDADSSQSEGVGIVNETFARRFFLHGSPIGHAIDIEGASMRVVGVVSDSKFTAASEEPMPMLYIPIAQQGSIGSEQIEVRAWGDPMALLPEIRRAVSSLDPMLPLEGPMTQAQQFALSYAQPTMFATMGGFFGALAALLVATGLYGTLAYRTSRRTMEIGVRMALGAQRRQVVWLVLRESLTLAAWGLALGAALLAPLTRLLGSMLWKLSPYDPVSIAVAVGGVLVVVAVASAAPARRAASVDPMHALRSE